MISSPTCSTPGTGATAAGSGSSSVTGANGGPEPFADLPLPGPIGRPTRRVRQRCGAPSAAPAAALETPPARTDPMRHPDRRQAGVETKAFQRRDERDDEGHQQRQHQRAEDGSIARRQLPAPISCSHFGRFPEVSGPSHLASIRRFSAQLPGKTGVGCVA